MLRLLQCMTLALSIASFGPTALSSERPEIVWGTDRWPHFTEMDGTGLYHDLIRAIFPEQNYHLSVRYMSWPRVVKALDNGTIDMTGAVKPDGSYYYSEQPLLSEHILVLARAERVNNSFINNLDRMTGAWRRGYRHAIVDKSALKDARGVAVDSPEMALKLLDKRRIDFYVDISSVIEKLGRDQLKGFRSKTIGHYNLYWAFRRSEQGQTLKHHFDKMLRRLKNSGKLQQIYQNYDIGLPN